MSYTELHTGTLHRLPISGEDNVKAFLIEQLVKKNPEKREEFSLSTDWDDICDELYYADINKNFYWNRKSWEIYEILNYKEYNDEEYINDWEHLPNGDIRFVTQFYNGGCSLDEVIDCELKNVNSAKI